MKQQDYILSELVSLESSLAGIFPRVPFQVPPGYFEHLPQQMLQLARQSSAEWTAMPLVPMPAFTIPDGYFDQLPERMLKLVREEEDSTHDELKSLSPLLGSLSRNMPFSVPDGYFSLPVLTSVSDAREETAALSTIVNNISRSTPFTLPDDYFKNLNIPIPAPARVVSMSFGKKMFRWAAAAIVAGLITTVAVVNFNREAPVSVDQTQAWMEKSMKKVSTEAIDNFVQLAEDPAAIVKFDVKNDIQSLMKDISDKEIQQFLTDTQAADAEADDDLIFN